MNKKSSLLKNSGSIYLTYVVWDGVITSGVFDSQVLGPLKGLRKNKEVKVSLVAFENAQAFLFQNKKLREKEREITSKLNIRASFYPRIPGWIGIYLVLLPLFISFSCEMLRRRRIVFSGRGTKSAFIGCKLKKVLPSLKVLYDVRGVEPEEYLYSLHLQSSNSKRDLTKKKKIFRKLKQGEEYVVGHADGELCVSSELKKYLLKSYSIEEKRINIVPCGIDEAVYFFDEKIREIVRKEMGLRNKLVFIYSGSMHPLQMPRAMLKLFGEFYKSDKEVFFLILTFEVEKAEKLLQYELVPQENYRVLSVEHSKVPMYLNAADIGILLREKNIVNRVACPTKFAEYMACGLYTVVTEEIGDISGMVEREKIGEVIKGSLDESKMKTVANRILVKRAGIQKKENKEKIAHLAQKYRWENLIGTLWKTYEGLFTKHDLR